MYLGTITGDSEDKEIIEALGIEILSSEPSVEGSVYVSYHCKVPNESMADLDKLWGVLYWDLQRAD